MSFEDIEVAWVACAVKEVIKGRGKRGRKRKIAVQEAEEPEPEVARMIDAPVPIRKCDPMRFRCKLYPK
jgi:hypothetical protein